MGLMGLDPFDKDAKTNGVLNRYDRLIDAFSESNSGALCTVEELKEFDNLRDERLDTQWTDVDDNVAGRGLGGASERERIENFMMSPRY